MQVDWKGIFAVAAFVAFAILCSYISQALGWG